MKVDLLLKKKKSTLLHIYNRGGYVWWKEHAELQIKLLCKDVMHVRKDKLAILQSLYGTELYNEFEL